MGKWEDEAGETELISEQVSHHPPATAYCVRNKKTGIQLEGYNAQKASFKSTIIVKQIGHAVLSIPVGDKVEKYLITLPGLHIEGLLFGAPFVELDGHTYIVSSTGYTSKIKFTGKGWVSGDKNSVHATLFPTGKEDKDKEVLYNMSGQWIKELTLYEGPVKKKSLLEVYDAAKTPQTDLKVKPTEQQHPLESRRAWSKVAEAISKGDMDTTSVEKSKIEQAQRDMRVKERSEDTTWERRYFTAAKEDDTLKALGSVAGIPADGEADKTGGLWRFDATKASKHEAETLSAEDNEKIEKELLGR